MRMKDQVESKATGSLRERIEGLEVRIGNLEGLVDRISKAVQIVCEQAGVRDYLNEPNER